MKKKKTKIWISIIFAFIGVLALISYFYVGNRQTNADEIIERASNAFKLDLNAFVINSGNSIDKLKTDVSKFDLESLPIDTLDVYITQLIRKNKYLKGLVLFSEQLNYTLFRDNNTWVTTAEKQADDTLMDWQRLNNRLEVVSEWTDTYNFFLDKDNMGSLRRKLKDDEQVIWRTVVSQIPDKRDLLFCVFRLRTKNEKPVLAALMYKTKELESRFGSVLLFQHPLITIIANDNSTVTPMRTTDTSVIAIYETLSLEVEKLVADWVNKRNGKPWIYSSENATFQQVYWTRVDGVDQQKNGLKGFAITVAESDIFASMEEIDHLFLYVTIICFLTAFIVLLSYRFLAKLRNYFSSDRKQSPPPELSPLSDDEQKQLIKKGETEFVEFKSSLRWDYREEKPNKVLEEVILKSIAAFANAKGGTLFIGVNDELEVIGLEADFNSLKKKDVDYFELHLRKLINNQYSIRFSNTFLFMQFSIFNGKTVCAIQVAPSNYPLYLKTKNKQGQLVEKFYVRSGNASQAIDLLKEINEYIGQRFKKN